VAFSEAGAGGGADGWSAEVEYQDDGFCDDFPEIGHVSTEGSLRTRYRVKVATDSVMVLAAVIDAVKADAERLGIRWADAAGPYVFYKGDGEHEDCPPPNGWRQMVNAQAERIGWQPFYRDREHA
jgi:hypothetical protein